MANKKTKNTEQKEKKELVWVDFANDNAKRSQIYNRREVKGADGKNVKLASVSFPKGCEHEGYHFDVAEKYIFPSSYKDKDGNKVIREKMSCVSFVAEQEVLCSKYNKETGENETVRIKAEDIKKEFNSWKNKDKNNDKSSFEQPAPSYASAEKSDEFEEIDV